MAATKGQIKGKQGERDIVLRLQPIVSHHYLKAGLTPPILQRNLDQSRSGGCDIIGLAWIAIEVKNHAVLAIPQWWAQTLRQARKDQVPVLIYKSGRKWRVMMFGRLPVGTEGVRVPVDITFESFLLYFEERVKLGVAKAATMN